MSTSALRSAALPLRRTNLRSTLTPMSRWQPSLIRQYGTPFVRPTRRPPLRPESSSTSRTPSYFANAGSVLSSFSMTSYIRFLGVGIGLVTLGTFYMKYLSILQIIQNVQASVSAGLATVKAKTEAFRSRVKDIKVPDEVSESVKSSMSAVSEVVKTKSGELGARIKEAKASDMTEVLESAKSSVSTVAEVVKVKSEELGATLKESKTAESVKSSVSATSEAVKAKSQELGARIREARSLEGGEGENVAKGIESVKALFKRDK